MKIVRYIEEQRGEFYPPKVSPVIECGCGAHVTCWDGWVNECPSCGIEYNGAGQMLSPRWMWGEETGEDFRDLARI